MTEPNQHPEIRADRRADRLTYLLLAGFMTASFLIEALSEHDEMRRADYPWPDIAWVSQASSHLVILALTPFIALMLSRFPISRQLWQRTLPIHIAAAVLFSAAHILLMVGLRKIFTPVFIGIPYEFGLHDLSVWLYEFRKDALTYCLIAAFFLTSRLAEQRRLEADAARMEAHDRHRVVLKSGGRTFLVAADDIILARAASNYVEVVTPSHTYLARSTLSELEKLLDAADGRHLRVHRSYIVNRDRIRAIRPTGDGNVSIELDTGDTVPGSRSYRDRLPGQASADASVTIS